MEICKWCNVDISHTYGDECHRCWELRHRIEKDFILSKIMLNRIEFELDNTKSLNINGNCIS